MRPFGRIDVRVGKVGAGAFGPLLDTALDLQRRVVAIDLIDAIHGACAVPHVLKFRAAPALQGAGRLADAPALPKQEIKCGLRVSRSPWPDLSGLCDNTTTRRNRRHRHERRPTREDAFSTDRIGPGLAVPAACGTARLEGGPVGHRTREVAGGRAAASFRRAGS
ncbi:hypothetical protein ACFZ8E_17555 [Methylobacterium sp. HMF5984]|uniref:hypothetical protein n=1 Tax=Methylobacterium sp. HMF5984 TaxID=3367370 RepID=UPI003854FBD5